MSEREEFSYDQNQLGTNGIGFIAIGLGLIGFILGTQRWQDSAPVIVLAVVLGLAMVVFGLIDLNKRGRTGVQVAVDREGITVVAKGPDPIPWAEVERCELVVGPKGASWLRVHLRYGAPSAARLRKTSLDIHDRILTGGARGLRQAIPRLAPQVPRNW